MLYVAEFYFGDDVVLLAFDDAGVPIFHAALSDALLRGSSELKHSGVTHEFRVQTGAADIELSDNHVVWRLDRNIAAEISEYLAAHGEAKHTGHQYVDIHTPAETLVISFDEYPPEFLRRVAEERI